MTGDDGRCRAMPGDAGRCRAMTGDEVRPDVLRHFLGLQVNHSQRYVRGGRALRYVRGWFAFRRSRFSPLAKELCPRRSFARGLNVPATKKANQPHIPQGAPMPHVALTMVPHVKPRGAGSTPKSSRGLFGRGPPCLGAHARPQGDDGR